jgi:hypothetical protein
VSRSCYCAHLLVITVCRLIEELYGNKHAQITVWRSTRGAGPAAVSRETVHLLGIRPPVKSMVRAILWVRDLVIGKSLGKQQLVEEALSV